MKRSIILTFTLATSVLTSCAVRVKDTSYEDTRPSLIELCAKHNTDKCHQAHNFIQFYDRLLTPKRDSVTRLFEIGVLRGSSHYMWQDFFPNAEIYGIDLKDYSELIQEERIHTFVADQSSREDLQKFIDKYGGDFDVIIDDGGHAMDHQQVSFGFLFKHLKPGGFFIIEDVHTSLPAFYPHDSFKVNEDGSNTTLLMLERYIRTSHMISEYMTEEEMAYLNKNIESIELTYRTNRLHSTMCIIQKKKHFK